jgi:hypothetical protein
LFAVAASSVLLTASPAPAADDSVSGHAEWAGNRDSDGDDRTQNPLLRGFKPWGPVGAPLPAGAELVTRVRFLELLSSGPAVPLSPTASEDEHHGHHDRNGESHDQKLHERFIMEFLREHPQLTDLKRIVTNQPSTSAISQPNADGTWTISPQGVKHPVETMGRSTVLSWVYNSVEFSRDRTGQLSLYTQLYKDLLGSADVAAGSATGRTVNELPTPDSLADASLATIGAALQLVARDSRAIYSTVPIRVLPAPLSCDLETGASPRHPGYGDRSGNDPSCGPIPGGLYATMNFLNKGYPTCVKDQGGRGTCHTFGITSATEERYSMDQGLRVNLSEQDEMEHYRFLWQRALYVDSGDPWEEINDVISLNYVYPLEHQWDYNPSYGRDTSMTPFTHSCDNVLGGEPCSDTAPQSAVVCADFGGFVLCFLYDPGIQGSKYRPTQAQYFWDSSNPELSAEYMLLQLAFNNSVVMAFSVSPAFESPRNGFVPYDPNDLAAKPLGGHVMHVVSFVSNVDLAQQLPGAPPGSGGGYFVVKNSWSACFGDGGYVYLPWDYMKAQTVEAFAVSQVN